MTSQVSQVLDEEHQGTLALLGALEQAVRTPVPAADFARLVKRLHEHLTQHVPKHFGFEEDVLFPRLADAGDGDLCELLVEEHVEINAVIAEVVPLAADVGRLDAASTAALRRGVSELCERLRSHIDKETAALLPSVENALTGEADGEIALAYASA